MTCFCLFFLMQQVSEEELKTSSVETDLKIEREWRQSLQEAADREKTVVANLQKKTSEYAKLKQVIYFIKTSDV